MEKLKDQLVAYLQEHEGFVASGDLQRVFFPKYAYHEKRGYHTPRSVVRRLEELVEEGKLQVDYRKNHAFYAILGAFKVKRQVVEIVETPEGRKAVVQYV